MKLISRLLTMALVMVASAATNDSLSEMVSLWTQRKYDVVLPELLRYREQPYGRKWQVDYMIGTIECHGAGSRSRGIAYLSNVLNYKVVPDPARTAAQQEITFCLQVSTSAQPQQPSFYLVPIAGQVTSPASVEGKGGYNFIKADGVVVTTKMSVTPVSMDELQKRVFSPDRADEALSAASTRLGGKTTGLIADGFVIVCTGHCYYPLAEVAGCLARYKQPLRTEFQMTLPANLITVYIPEDLAAVQAYAGRLHGVQLPLGTVAYSVLEDLSMVGIAGEGCGSLAHELTHLSIKNNFGDSPAWLEEGLASEVAVGTPAGDSIRFSSSWRDTTLRETWNLRPTVAALISMNWSDFAATNESSVPKVAAIHAMAAVFVRYLDQKGKLRAVYSAIRDGRFSPDSANPRKVSSIVEEQLGMNLTDVDTDFVRWFGGNPTSQPSRIQEKKPQAQN